MTPSPTASADGPPSFAATGSAAADYRVEVDRADRGWEVRIVDAAGRPASVRPCGSETEARTFASTVIQHLGWLSVEKFREYHRLEGPEG
jgi:hypothetical protein